MTSSVSPATSSSSSSSTHLSGAGVSSSSSSTPWDTPSSSSSSFSSSSSSSSSSSLQDYNSTEYHNLIKSTASALKKPPPDLGSVPNPFKYSLSASSYICIPSYLLLIFFSVVIFYIVYKRFRYVLISFTPPQSYYLDKFEHFCNQNFNWLC